MYKHFLTAMLSTIIMLSTAHAEVQPFTSYSKNSIVQHEGKEMWLEEFGSGIQWNEDYVVTAKHLKDLVKGEIVYTCPNSCDIIFVKSKAKGEIPVWRDRVENEQITISGLNPKGKSSFATGNDLNKVAAVWNNQDIKTYLSSAETFDGMSGGPVTGKDNQVIGMLTGNVNLKKAPDWLKVLSPKDSLSVYIPYDEIKNQWDIFQAQK